MTHLLFLFFFFVFNKVILNINLDTNFKIILFVTVIFYTIKYISQILSMIKSKVIYFPNNDESMIDRFILFGTRVAIFISLIFSVIIGWYCLFSSNISKDYYFHCILFYSYILLIDMELIRLNLTGNILTIIENVNGLADYFENQNK